MSLEGDEWKNETCAVQQPTRAEQQSRINADYATGKISLERWRSETSRLSGCDRDGDAYRTP